MAPSRKKGAAAGDRSSLFAHTYDRDAPAYSSVPSAEYVRASSSSHLELGSDNSSDDDDHLSTTPQDLDVLKEEEEREKLLSKGGLFGSIGRREGVVIGKRVKGARRKKRAGLGGLGREDSEERIGGGAGEYSSGEDGYGDESEDEEIEEIRRGWLDEKKSLRGEPRPRSPSIRRIASISIGLLTFLIVLIYASLRLSLPGTADQTPSTTTTDSPTSAAPPETLPFHATPLSNGTHTYHPTTILISLDGFRASYLQRNRTPTLQSFINSGVSTPFLTPAFPSVTFPNHWTLVTGLHPESHGIVGNSFFDPVAKQEYYYTDRTSATLPFWYGGSAIWFVAEENGVKTAIHMWPGSETYIYHPESFVHDLAEFQKQKPGADMKRLKPTIVDEYSGKEDLGKKAARLLGWLDLPLESRPQLVLGYVPNLDAVGHKFGPDTDEETVELGRVDDMFRLLLEGIEARNLTEIVNIVVVSDHGMAKSYTEQLIYLEDVLGEEAMQKISGIEGWPLSGLRPQAGVNETQLWEEIRGRHQSWPPNTPTGKKAVKAKGKGAPWNVYHRDHDMPQRWHFSNNERIAPIWIVPEVGWVCVDKDEYPPDNMPKQGYHPKGVHGYDNLAEEMRALFVGWGPGFRKMGLHGEGREWLGLGGVGVGKGENFDVHDAVDDDAGERLERRVDVKGKEVKGVKVAPFGNWNIYGIIGELLFGAEDAGRFLAPNNGTLAAGGVGRGGMLEGMRVLTQEEWENGKWEAEEGEKEGGGDELVTAKPETAVTSAHRPVIEKPNATSQGPSITPSASASPQPEEPTTTTEVDGSTISAPPSSTSASASPTPSAPIGEGDGGGEEKDPDLDHKPAGMTWWKWAKWRAAKLKEKLEKWWGKVLGGKGGKGGEKGGKEGEGKGKDGQKEGV